MGGGFSLFLGLSLDLSLSLTVGREHVAGPLPEMSQSSYASQGSQVSQIGKSRQKGRLARPRGDDGLSDPGGLGGPAGLGGVRARGNSLLGVVNGQARG